MAYTTLRMQMSQGDPMYVTQPHPVCRVCRKTEVSISGLSCDVCRGERLPRFDWRGLFTVTLLILSFLVLTIAFQLFIGSFYDYVDSVEKETMAIESRLTNTFPGLTLPVSERRGS